ncbi:unnamed protein product [Protopolystoma xenopodis]|uniref:FZ domain-containing protein n=1 Tax=Protopolystoma xenopodis TaxID=117903 RepID=A0A448WBS1_9PLAT|nr:unnamed protein product [Protopolystoma xenopodis]
MQATMPVISSACFLSDTWCLQMDVLLCAYATLARDCTYSEVRQICPPVNVSQAVIQSPVVNLYLCQASVSQHRVNSSPRQPTTTCCWHFLSDLNYANLEDRTHLSFCPVGFTYCFDYFGRRLAFSPPVLCSIVSFLTSNDVNGSSDVEFYGWLNYFKGFISTDNKEWII